MRPQCCLCVYKFPPITIKTTSFTPPSVIKLYLLFVYLITLGGVNEVVLIVLTSVTDQK
jgi:hypothetical protein